MINRRALITGLISFVAAPAIVKASSIMPVKSSAECVDWLYKVYIDDEYSFTRTAVHILYGNMEIERIEFEDIFK